MLILSLIAPETADLSVLFSEKKETYYEDQYTLCRYEMMGAYHTRFYVESVLHGMYVCMGVCMNMSEQRSSKSKTK